MDIMKKLFINRKAELQKLSNGLKRDNDYVLIAPRRFGKTALAKKVLDGFSRSEDYIVVRIDLMSYSSGSVGSVAECIIEKILNALGFDGKLRKMWRNMDFTFNLRMKYQDLEIEPLLHMFKNNDEWALLEEALQLPEKIALRKNKKVIVFYDEFGELHKLGERVIQLFRSVIQHHEAVNYLFAGSQETVMNEIFLKKSGAFYRFGELIYLHELDRDDVYQYVVEHYPNVGGSQVGLLNVMNVLLEQLHGHPYYTAQVVEYFEENRNCTYEEFYKYLLTDLFERERAYIEQQLQAISDKQHAVDVLRIIALGYNPYNELHAISEQHVYAVLRYLETGGHIRKQTRGIYKIVDPLLSMLLLGE